MTDVIIRKKQPPVGTIVDRVEVFNSVEVRMPVHAHSQPSKSPGANSDYQGPDLYTFIGFIGFIGPDDIN